jgi:hypothetical protein
MDRQGRGIFFPIDNRQTAIGNVVIESTKSTKFSNCQIALLPNFYLLNPAYLAILQIKQLDTFHISHLIS